MESSNNCASPFCCRCGFFLIDQVNFGTDKNKQVQLTYPLHPMLVRSFAVLEPMFIQQVLPASGHGLLADSSRWTALLESLPDAADAVRQELLKQWSPSSSSKKSTTPEEKWQQLKEHIRGFVKASAKGGANKASKHLTSKDRNRIEQWPVEVVFRHTYPRLDVNVSKMRNHLLKSPFCVHPKTGRVCVPFLAEQVDNFDPFAVPTLSQLMRELDEYEKQDTGDSNNADLVPNWAKTSLKPYFEAFQSNFLRALTKENRRKERDEAEKVAAMTGDF